MRDHIFNLHATPSQDRSKGLHCWLSFEQGAHILGGITLREDASGGYTLSYPKHRDRFGVSHPLIRPIDQAARDDVTDQVVAELRRRGMLS
jgi:hypothetical protein